MNCPECSEPMIASNGIDGYDFVCTRCGEVLKNVEVGKE